MTSPPSSEYSRSSATPPSPDPSQRSGARKWIFLATGGALALVIVASLLWLDFPSAGPGLSIDSPSPTPTTAPTLPAASSTDDLTESGAEETLTVFLSVVAAGGFTEEDLGAIETVATGAILDEIRSEQSELEANGWTKHGESSVESVTVLESQLDATPATATVQACIDSSGVTILDHDGEPIGAPTSPRALNIFTLTLADSAWKVTKRTFPDNPSC